MNKEDFKVCTRCVMDTTAKDITFDENGVCNFCTEYIRKASSIINPDHSILKNQLEKFVHKIKEDGKNKEYDCIIGVSGGVDSSWVLVKAVEFGLRPFVVHMDGGWNAELADKNIQNLVKKLGVELHTVKVDEEHFNKLLKAYLDSDTIDIEILYDNAMLAINYMYANKYGIKWILSGSNKSTEGLRIPENWNWYKMDKKNILDVIEKCGNISIKSFPTFGTFDFVFNAYVKKIKWTSILDMMEYKKADVMKKLVDEYDYIPYPYKHYESILTRFYQGYILPVKFGVDKRKVHHSTLIASGQMSRDYAIEDLKKNPYVSEKELNDDVEYFLNKLNISKADLEDYISRPRKEHTFYDSEINIYKFLVKIYKLFNN